MLDEIIRSNSINYTLVAILLLGILTVISVIVKNRSDFFKYLLFAGFVLVSILTTLYLVGSTIYLNQKSVTGGPVHYHADFEIYNCGQKIDLVDPEGFSNKVGTEILHEHNDNRIHVEGPVLKYEDISLGNFFKVVGGNLDNNSLTIPTNDGLVVMEDGQLCQGEEGRLQVFVYKQSLPSSDGRTKSNSFNQEKLKDPAGYVLSPYSQVPPGDCIIIEFDIPKDKTEKLCTFYQVAKDKGEIQER